MRWLTRALSLFIISKSGKTMGTRLTFTKIKKNPNRPTLLANPVSGDGKWTFFKVQSYISNQTLFSIWPKSEGKILNILRTKKRLSLKQIKQIFFGRWESDLKPSYWAESCGKSFIIVSASNCWNEIQSMLGQLLKSIYPTKFKSMLTQRCSNKYQ